MRRLTYSLLGIAALAGCPYDTTAAGLTADDGGLWFGTPGDGGILLPSTTDAALTDVESEEEEEFGPVPDENTLCQLVVGNYREAVDGEYDYDRRRLGTWIDDVEQHILGMPKRNAESLGKEDAQVTYQWKTGGVTLRFEQLNRWYTSKGVVPRSYYLSEIATRNLPYLDCWRFDFGGRIKQPAPTVPCPECELQCGGCCSICIAPACEKCADR